MQLNSWQVARVIISIVDWRREYHKDKTLSSSYKAN